MTLRILYFGILKELMGRESEPLSLPSSLSVEDLLSHLREKNSAHISDALWRSLAVSVNQQYATLNHPLHDGDEVALLPPVSGGSAN